MTVRDLVDTWRRPLVFLAQGLFACSLALLYLFIGLALCSGDHTARTAPPSHSQESLGKESIGSSPSSVVEEKPSAVSEATLVWRDTSFNKHRHSYLSDGHSLATTSQGGAYPLVIPRIVVQDFSSEDGLIRYKTPECDLTDVSRRRRRPSRARISPEDRRCAVTVRPSSLRPPTPGALTSGGLRHSYPTDGSKRRRSDVLVQNLLGFSGRERVLGDVVAKDGSFVIVGL